MEISLFIADTALPEVSQALCSSQTNITTDTNVIFFISYFVIITDRILDSTKLILILIKFGLKILAIYGVINFITPENV